MKRMIFVFHIAALFFLIVSCTTQQLNSKNTKRITTEQWSEQNKDAPHIKRSNGIIYKLFLVNILEPGKVDITPQPTGDNATLAGLTNAINKSFDTNYTEEQIKQIYKISNEQKMNIADIIDNSIIDSNGNIEFKIGAK